MNAQVFTPEAWDLISDNTWQIGIGTVSEYCRTVGDRKVLG